MNIAQARFNMIEQQIRPWDVSETAILELLSVVRREDFVPAAHRALAFVDMALPLASPAEAAIARGQVMLPPRVEARMLQDLQLKRTDRVLEIGTGSGYMAALLAHRAKSVLTLEIDQDLADNARHHLAQAGIGNVEVRVADGTKAIAGGPFDAIVLSGSVGSVPSALLDLLADGGRLMGIVGQEPVMRATLITRTGPGQFTTTEPWDTTAPRLIGFADATPTFRF